MTILHAVSFAAALAIFAVSFPAGAADPGADYAAKAAKEKGAVKTTSGLVFRSVSEGKGAKPSAASTVKVKYKGTFPDGKVFDEGGPITFPLNGVIACWTEGLQMMKVGGKAKIVCPPEIAYGANGNPGIPGNAVLTFDVELLEIVK